MTMTKPDRGLRDVAVASGMLLAATGTALVGVGLWARREVATALARERVVSTPDATPPNALVTSAAAARSLAEVIREHTLEATGGRTYAETPQFLDRDGKPTANADLAQKDGTGRPIENPERALWLQSTTLQTALVQAYLGARVGELTAGLGVALAVAGAGIAAAGAARR
ncbi:MAG TPA: hypothetical protein VIA10_03700 [Gaiellaceae bacterium]|jgi:hypothetical protein